VKIPDAYFFTKMEEKEGKHKKIPILWRKGIFGMTDR
jgi:hypothetical protein